MTDHEHHEHLSVDRLADLAEGQLDPVSARAAEEHLRECSRCAADRDDLARVPARLAAAAWTGPVPDDVVARLDAALAAERRTPSATGAVTVTPLRAGTGAPWGMRVLQVAAVLVLLIAGVGLALTALGGGSDDENAARTTADSGGEAGSEAAPESGGAYPVGASGRDWDKDTLVAAVPQLVAGSLGDISLSTSPPAPVSPGAGADTSGDAARELADSPAARLAEGPALAECVGRLYEAPVTPLAVDLARWMGEPAAVIVLPTADDPATVDVYVVRPACPPGELLLFAREARP